PGEPLLPLAKTASGGELARAMLAIRLVLTQGPPTLVFDEVDAGVGGEAALAVGEALANVAERHQVLVVTHLPQVAAFAQEQVAVAKRQEGGRTVASARPVRGGDRVVELSRMLSGQPASEAARGHAEELLAAAGIQLVDDVGPELMERISEGQVVRLEGPEIFCGDDLVAKGTWQTLQSLEEQLDSAKRAVGDELERFAENTLEYLRQER